MPELVNYTKQIDGESDDEETPQEEVVEAENVVDDVEDSDMDEDVDDDMSERSSQQIDLDMLQQQQNEEEFDYLQQGLGENEYESDDDDDYQYLQKFDKDLRKKIVQDYHPELIIHSNEDIQAYTKIVRNEQGVIVDPLHTTLPFVTKYERARILG